MSSIVILSHILLTHYIFYKSLHILRSCRTDYMVKLFVDIITITWAIVFKRKVEIKSTENHLLRRIEKSKITKILNFEENSKRKVPHQMAKSNDKTHQTIGQQLSYSWLGICIFKCRNVWLIHFWKLNWN